MVDPLRTEDDVVPATYGVVGPRIPVKDFDPALYDRGQKFSLDLELGPEAAGVTFPLLLVRGASEGKTLVVSAGIHGDEFEGVQAILQVVAELDPSIMSGTVIAVPVANLPAFYKGTRTSPLDDRNLARCFPGAERGTPTEILAFHLGESIIARADFYLDLHSAGVKLLMPTMVGYDPLDPRSRDAAGIFGTPVVWGHPSIEPGRTISFAASRKIPWLYTEARGAGRVHPQDLAMFKRGIFNLLMHLGILPGRVTSQAIERVLYGDGNVDAAIAATRPGFLIRAVELLQDVYAEQELGRTVDLHGRLIELFRSPNNGVIGMIRAFPVVESGNPLFLITGSRKSLF
jgi:predicted deacylase